MSINEILEILEKQLEHYGSLLDLINQKRTILISNDVEQLNVFMKKERQQLQIAEALEQERIRLTNKYFLKCGIIRSRAGTISDMVRIVTNAEEKTKLLHYQKQLSSLLGEIRKVNELNQQLIAQSLQFIEYSIDLLIDDPTEAITYQHPKNPTYGGVRNGIFDTRG
ncbi:flagellar protein FlgN [Paenibacillus sp. GCM10027626]|uniref:flagellar protein FlgN n=1 Tax=Paenibacillus sp. GCM10027626 TaxID=3273411 RepID=UPI003639B338